MNARAVKAGKRAPVSRINPDVDAFEPTPRFRPARRKNKFGITFERAREVYARAAAMPASK